MMHGPRKIHAAQVVADTLLAHAAKENPILKHAWQHGRRNIYRLQSSEIDELLAVARAEPTQGPGSKRVWMPDLYADVC